MTETHAHLSTKQEIILAMIKEKGKITVSGILPQLGISDRAIRKHLAYLMRIGLVKMVGNKKSAAYTLT
jgi:predicted HTH transcriptional regulator